MRDRLRQIRGGRSKMRYFAGEVGPTETGESLGGEESKVTEAAEMRDGLGKVREWHREGELVI